MWLGMLAAALGQVPAIPVEPVVWLAGALAGFVAQVAAWFAAPSWAQVEAPLPDLGAVAAFALALGGAIALAARWTRRRAALLPRALGHGTRLALALAAIAVCLLALALGSGTPPAAPEGLRIRFMDVGQGDAILLEPEGAAPVLVDAGTADAGVAETLAESGVDRLGAVVVTHPESDHAGGVAAVLDGLEVGRLLFARTDHPTLAAARAAEVAVERIEQGDRIRSGRLRLDVLWPPAARVAAARAAGGPSSGDPNETSLVLLARWRGFAALLSGDAEAEVAPVHPGPVALLKVAHHGSEDAGLPALLAETRPRVAVISAGTGNPYGHPAPATVAALEHAGVRSLRTDHEGEIVVEVGDRGWHVR
jgi:competence protein ComEC